MEYTLWLVTFLVIVEVVRQQYDTRFVFAVVNTVDAILLLVKHTGGSIWEVRHHIIPYSKTVESREVIGAASGYAHILAASPKLPSSAVCIEAER